MSDDGAPIGRNTEADAVRQFLSDSGSAAHILLVEGAVGIGKTTVLAWARDLAANLGLRVLSASPDEAEFPLEFAGLADLLDDLPVGALDALPAPQALAIRAAVLREQSPAAPLDARTIATGALTILRGLAQVCGIVLVVDDLPWLDTASARVLSFALRRVGGGRVLLVGSARTDAGAPAPIPALAGVDPTAIRHLSLGGLSLGAIRSVLDSHALAVPRRSALLRLHSASGGNPLFAIELAASTASGAELGETSDLGENSLTIPPSLRHLVADRVNELSAGQRELVLAIALSEDPTLPVISAAVPDPAGAEDDLADLVAARVVGLQGSRITFTHPLLRSLVISEARPGQRRAMHLRLALASPVPESRARHLGLAATGPDETVAGEVERAAVLAADRGACDSAAELAELAVALTPPARIDNRQRRILLEAESRFEASDPGRACALATGIVDELAAGPTRARVLRRLASFMLYSGTPLVSCLETLNQALSECGVDGGLRAEILGDLAMVASNAGDQAGATRYAGSCLELAREVGDQRLVAQMCGGLAWVGFLTGEGVRRELIEPAVSGPDQSTRLPMALWPKVVVAHILHMTDDLDGARRLYEEELVRARAAGLETGLPLLLWGLVQTETYAGRWERAERLAAEGHALAQEADSSPGVYAMVAVRGLLNVCRGRLDEGRRDAELAIEFAQAQGVPFFAVLAAQSMGLARLSVGDPLGAHEVLRPFVEDYRAAGPTEPGALRFVPDEIEALIRLGRTADATAMLDPYEERAVALGRRSAVAAAGRCRGLLLAALGDLAGAEAVLGAALEVHDGLDLPFDEARTLLVSGEVHRRARHKILAEQFLQRALTAFQTLGAPLWVRRAQEELDGLGLRRAPAGSTLTVGERRVADLVSEGLTTTQVAAQLFMGRRTVESHLSQIYRKLGVRTRTEMARMHSSVQAADRDTRETSDRGPDLRDVRIRRGGTPS